MYVLYVFICLFLWGLLLEDACGADWPMRGYGASRGGTSPEELPETLYLQWERQLARPAPAWPAEQYKLQFDRSYEPVVASKTLFVASMAGDKVTAYDTATGAEKWRFYCDGPVRFGEQIATGPFIKLYLASRFAAL